MSSIEEIEARRAARKAKLQADADVQRAKDLEALDAAEVEHGDTSVCRIDVSYTPGLPTMAIGRKPTAPEMKRHRARVKVKPGEALDLAGNHAASEELGASVLLYPDAEMFAKMCEARPDLKAQLGQRAQKLAQGKEAEESKD